MNKSRFRAHARSFRIAAILALVLAGSAVGVLLSLPDNGVDRVQAATPKQNQRYQAVWVDAFHDGFKTPEQTRELVRWARRHFVNALFIEVRKTADAYYKSSYEPAASDISPKGYDPLADLIRQAHNVLPNQPKIEIHAWIILYRVGVGKALPKNHVTLRHPDWLSETYDGEKDEEGHIHLDPGVPGVLDYTTYVVADLVKRYDLDGIHFDRIRYPSRQWGYNKIALSRFRNQTRRLRKPKPDDPEWSDFRRNQINATLVRLYAIAKSRRPSIRVSAATVAFDDLPADFKKSRPYYDALQDWPAWNRSGWLDINCLMAYKREGVAEQAKQYRQWLGFLAKNHGFAAPIVGQGSFLNSPAASLRQVNMALKDDDLAGVSLYSYAQLAAKESQGPLFAENLRHRYFEAGRLPPVHYALDQTKYGWVAGTVAGTNVDGIAVTLSTAPEKKVWTDGSGFFAFNNVLPGEYKARAEIDRGRTAEGTVKVQAGRVTGARLEP